MNWAVGNIALVAPAPVTHTFNGTGGDDTAAIQALVNGLSAGDTLVINGASLVSTIALWYMSDVTIRINGCVKSVFTSQPTSKPYTGAPSGNPVFGIFGCSDITIAGSYIENTYDEAVVACGTTGLHLSCNIYGAGVGTNDGIFVWWSPPSSGQTYSGDPLTISNCEIKNVSVVPATGYGSGKGIDIQWLPTLGGTVSNCRVHDCGGGGIYLWAGYNLLLEGNYVYNNSMDGIQINCNAVLDATQHFTINGNYVFNNRSDGIDMDNFGNASTAPYPNYGVDENNYLSYNGWCAGASTPDGSGVCTCWCLQNMQVLDNIAIGENRTGIFFTGCTSCLAQGNVISKTSNSQSNAGYDSAGNGVTFDTNDLYCSVSGQATLEGQGIVSLTWSNDFINGGTLSPSGSHSGLTKTNTPKSTSNYYRYSTSDSNNFAVTFGTPSSGYTTRVVAWTNDSAGSSVTLPLTGTVKETTMSGQVSYIVSQGGSVTVPLSYCALVMLDWGQIASSSVNVSQLSALKSLTDSTGVNINEPVVVTVGSGVFSDGRCYVEDSNRSYGFEVMPGSGVTLYDGDVVIFSGTMGTDSDGERLVSITSLASQQSGDELNALGMDGRIVNGSSVTGLMVKTWGLVSSRGLRRQVVRNKRRLQRINSDVEWHYSYQWHCPDCGAVCRCNRDCWSLQKRDRGDPCGPTRWCIRYRHILGESQSPGPAGDS